MSYLHKDQLGSIRAISGDYGALMKQSAYTPFGEVTDWTNATFPTGETKGYIGERYDAGAGLQYLNARYYDPRLGIFIQPDWFEVMQPGVGTNRYGYAGNDPVNNWDPYGNAWYNDWDDFKETVTETVGTKTTTYSDGTVEVRSGSLLRSVVPGQVAWDNARSAYYNENYTEAAIYTVAMVGETAVTGATLGFGSATVQAERIAAQEAAIIAENQAVIAAEKAVHPVVANGIRGRAAEARILKELGLKKNTSTVSTELGNSIPDALTKTASIEIKDTKVVALTKQLRIQASSAAASGRQSILVTGKNTHVTQSVLDSFDRVIRNPTIGPQ